ncbi:hypothetical protein SAMN04487987_101472 [Algibacter pectinivorans]|uniref:Uncharacterized protein n=1 Tax=Algibacter pectinivorans TaxID=870482 RepID=A0A1I1MRT9_9FLAO|nr:hypothetical protein SAMN04487987_101472 [Algibacter pectinivorans]
MVINKLIFWALPLGSGYPIQVLAPPSSGCGLSFTIPSAGKTLNIVTNTKQKDFCVSWYTLINSQSYNVL